LYDALSSRASKLEDEVSQLRQKDLVQSLTLKSVQEERENLTSRVANLDQAQDMLRMDKMYLTKETERLSDCYRDARQSIERLEVKNGELKRQKDELVDKLVKVREEHQQSYEEKLSAELNRLQSRTTADLESIRRTQKEAFEREISGLKEAREHAIAEAERQRTAAESTREDLTALQEEHRRLQSTLETERSDSRNALKLKSFEHDRLSLTYEECLSDLRKLKIEHEVLGKKCSLVKQELFTLQSDSQKSINDLENQNKNLTEKLSMYQQLEYELDMAILGAGGLAADGGEDGAAGGSGPVGAKAGVRGIHAILESLGSNIPTANKRRMKQSILLAQQLVEKQKQIDVLTKELAHYKERNAELDAELDASRRALACTSQPHSYLITALQAKESDLASANRALEQAQQRLAEREKDLARCIDAKAAVEADMHKLLAGRQAVDGIKQALMREQGRHGAALQQLDQQFAAQQGGGARQAVTLSNFKENRQPQASSFGQPSPNDPRNFSPYNIGGGGGLLAQSQPQQQQYPQQNQFASSGSSLSSSQGRPTSSFATHNKSLAGDAALDAQPKPLWSRKLAQ
jgi:chromosome segregation ATPase